MQSAMCSNSIILLQVRNHYFLTANSWFRNILMLYRIKKLYQISQIVFSQKTLTEKNAKFWWKRAWFQKMITKMLPEWCEETTTTRVMQSPGWTTWVRAQTRAVLGISFDALTATTTFSATSQLFSSFPPFFKSSLIFPIENYMTLRFSKISSEDSTSFSFHEIQQVYSVQLFCYCLFTTTKKQETLGTLFWLLPHHY